jgi:serine/threonine protein kinase
MLRKLGRYEIVEELGRGAMGVIYKAKDPAIGRFVAIKTVRLGDFTDPSHLEELRSRLQREAQAAGALLHPHIITIFDVGEEEGLSYYAMELVEGTTLEDLIDSNQRLDQETIVHIARQAADALGFAHRTGIVHRDIKPANIMLTRDGRVKIADFGIAKVGSTKMTQTGMLLGSPSYMAPEHFLGQGLDGRSDIFALGIVLYELITGQPPFTAENLGTLSYKIVHEDAVPPIRIRPDLDPLLNAIVAKALARDPAERFQSAEELRAALDAIPANQMVARQKMADIAERPLFHLKTEPLASTVAVASPPKRSRRWVLVFVLLLLAGAGTAAAFFYPDEVNTTIQLAKSKFDPWLDKLKRKVSPSKPPESESQPASPKAGTESTTQPDKRKESLASQVPALDPATPPLPEKPPSSGTQAEPPLGEPSPPASIVPKTPVSPEPGTIQVSSTPPGAEIVLDDQFNQAWHTPHSFQSVSKGRHTLEIRKSGYLTERRIVVLLGSETQRINVVLTLAAGILKVSTVPSGAQIYVDGELKPEVTPASLKIRAGARRISLRKEGYHDVEQVIEIEDNSITTLNRQLSQLPQ